MAGQDGRNESTWQGKGATSPPEFPITSGG